jgi:hypothetical protein
VCANTFGQSKQRVKERSEELGFAGLVRHEALQLGAVDKGYKVPVHTR